MSTVTIELHTLEDFLTELDARPPVPEPVVRLTGEWRRLGESPDGTVTLIATYLRHVSTLTQIVELRLRVGEDGDDPVFARPETRERFETLRRRLEKDIGERGYTVAPGRVVAPAGRPRGPSRGPVQLTVGY